MGGFDIEPSIGFIFPSIGAISSSIGFFAMAMDDVIVIDDDAQDWA